MNAQQKADWTLSDGYVVRHFIKREFRRPDELRPRVIRTLDEMRYQVDQYRRVRGEDPIFIRIHDDVSPRPDNPGSYHPQAMAVDFSIWNKTTHEPLDAWEQFLLCRLYPWGGLGLYPFWNNPGCHGDIRPLSIYQPFATWWRDEDGKYLAVEEYIKRRWGHDCFK